MKLQLHLRGVHVGALALLASCTLLGQPLSPDELIKRQVNQLQVNIERHIPGETPVRAAIVGILDTTAAPPVEGAEPTDPEMLREAQRRERMARQELGALLVVNRLFELVQPTEAQIQSARVAMSAGNSPALDAALVSELGAGIGVQYILGALIDSNGKYVSLCAQKVPDGVVLFQDTLINWTVLLPVQEEAAQ